MPKNFMSEKNFDLLLQSIQEGKDFRDGTADKSKYRVTVVVPKAIDVKAIRSRLDLSQVDFSTTFGFSLKSVQFWVQGRRLPEASARAFLKLIDKAPEFVLETLSAA
ncbi:MAG: transcriptional regulator [Pseudomonadota bacterium]